MKKKFDNTSWDSNSFFEENRLLSSSSSSSLEDTPVIPSNDVQLVPAGIPDYINAQATSSDSHLKSYEPSSSTSPCAFTAPIPPKAMGTLRVDAFLDNHILNRPRAIIELDKYRANQEQYKEYKKVIDKLDNYVHYLLLVEENNIEIDPNRVEDIKLEIEETYINLAQALSQKTSQLDDFQAALEQRINGSTPIISHSKLIKVMANLNYLAAPKGLCVGIFQVCVDAFFSGQLKTYAHYFKLLNVKRYTELSVVNNSIFNFDSKQKSREDINLLALFQSVALYHSPNDFNNLFNQPALTQLDLHRTSPLVQPEIVQKKGGYLTLNLFSGIFNKNELQKCLELIHSEINKNNSSFDFALRLSANDHAFGFCFSKAKKNWTFVDANYLHMLNYPFSFEQRSLSELIFAALLQENNIVLNIKIQTTREHKDAVEKLVAQVSSNPEVKKLLQTSEERANQDSLSELAIHAAENNEHNKLKALKKLGINLYQKVKKLDDIDPTLAAIHYNALESLRVTLKNNKKLRSSFDSQGINYSYAYHAVYMARADALQILAEHHTDLNLVSSTGFTPAGAAAALGYIDILYILAKNGVDLKKQSKQFFDYLGKHHPYPEAFAQDTTDDINHRIPERMHVVKQLHDLVIGHQEKKLFLYNLYRHAMINLDNYVRGLLASEFDYLEFTPHQLQQIDNIIQDEYTLLAYEIEKQLANPSNHKESLIQKLSAAKKSIMDIYPFHRALSFFSNANQSVTVNNSINETGELLLF